MQSQNKTFKLVFASSSEFTLPILQDIIKNQGKTLFEIYQQQHSWLATTVNLFEEILPAPFDKHFHDFKNIPSELQLPLELSLVISQPDRVHRSKIYSNPIVKYSRDSGLALFTPEKLNSSVEKLIRFFSTELEITDNLKPVFDSAIVASYGQIVSSKVLALAKHGYINWHPSLLPLFRGPTPMPSLIAQGVEKTGLSWIEMTRAMDAGNIWLQVVTSLSLSKTLDGLTDLMANIGANTWSIPIVAKLLGLYNPIVQDESKATFTKMLSKQDRWVNPKLLDSVSLYRNWLAYKKFPGVSFIDDYFQGEVRLIEMGLPVASLPTGNIVYQDENWIGQKNQNFEVYLKTKDGCIQIKTIQLENGQTINFQGFQFKTGV